MRREAGILKNNWELYNMHTICTQYEHNMNKDKTKTWDPSKQFPEKVEELRILFERRRKWLESLL